MADAPVPRAGGRHRRVRRPRASRAGGRDRVQRRAGELDLRVGRRAAVRAGEALPRRQDRRPGRHDRDGVRDPARPDRKDPDQTPGVIGTRAPSFGRVCAIVHAMRIATWNVNSLKARLEKVTGWLKRAEPDLLLMQETKLGDAAAPSEAFAEAGYRLRPHGEGRWYGGAIDSPGGPTGNVNNLRGALPPAPAVEDRGGEPRPQAREIGVT